MKSDEMNEQTELSEDLVDDKMKECKYKLAIFNPQSQGEARANQACVYTKIIKISSRTRLWPPVYSPSIPPLVAAQQTEYSEVWEDYEINGKMECDEINKQTEHSEVLEVDKIDENIEDDEINQQTVLSEDLKDDKMKEWKYKLAMIQLQFRDEDRAERYRVYTSFIKKITSRTRRLAMPLHKRPRKRHLVRALRTEHREVLEVDEINKWIESSEINKQNERNEVLECDNANEKIELKVLPEFGEINEKINTMEPLCKEGTLMEELSNLVTEVSSFMESQLQRKPMPESNWRVFIQLMELCYNFLQEEKQPYRQLLKKLDFVADVFFCIQTSCAGCCHDDDLTVSAKDLLQIPIDILAFLFAKGRFAIMQDIVVFRRSLQLVGNIVCQSSTAKEIIWKTFNEKKFFRFFLCVSDDEVHEHTIMILYHCLTPMQGNIMSNTYGRDLIFVISDHLTSDGYLFDWGILILELVIYEREFMEGWYFTLTSAARLLVLDIIDGLLECPRSDIPIIPVFVLNGIKTSLMKSMEDFLEHCEFYVKEKRLEAVEIAKQVSLLRSASIHPSANRILRKFPELIEASLDTLNRVLLAGQENSNAFSNLTSLKELSEVMKEEIANHPSFCLKRNLICLIGNLCAGSRENQDLVREYDGIPLLLDCCKLDYRNPYLLDWCILAIQSILEDNVENQTVLACLTYEEKTVNSPFLAELGFTVEMENERPVLKPKI